MRGFSSFCNLKSLAQLIFSSSAFVIHVNPQPFSLLYDLLLSLVFFFPGTFRFPSI